MSFAGRALALPLPLPLPPSDCEQAPTLRIGTALDDQILDGLVNAAGDILIGGYENGQLGIENDWPVGNSRGFVELRRADGSLAWRHIVDTAGIDTVEALAYTPEGLIAVTGRTSGALPGFSNAGQLDVFIMLLSPDGERLSTLQVGDARPQRPTDLVSLASGELVVVGYDDNYVEGGALIDWENGILLRIAQDANQQLRLVHWLRSRLPEPDRIYSVAAAEQGSADVLIASHRNTSARLGGGAYVQRIGAGGDQVWQRVLGAHPADALTRLQSDSAGRVFAAGSFLSALGGAGSGSSEAVLLRLAPDNGDTIWARRIGYLDPDWLSSLAIDGEGDLHVAGIATPIEDVDQEIQRSYVFGARYNVRGRRLNLWSSQPAAAQRLDIKVSVLPGRCPDLPRVGVSINGDLGNSPTRGRFDGVISTADVL